ncbi:MAG TPA: SgcJ/EcaC family oxidoreductase [Blastocatellia bacterium]|nr:SgcJ/EcaC family oxidoreductase [Blastocatellia bacterium]
MQRFLSLLIVIASIASPLAAQTKGSARDEEAVKRIALKWQESWNRHDMKALATLIAEDADLITVSGTWLRSRKEFEEDHTKGHETIFKGSVLTMEKTEVKFIKPDVAVAHAEWSIKYGQDAEGRPRQPQRGIFTWVVEKRQGEWLIIAAQNTFIREQPASK